MERNRTAVDVDVGLVGAIEVHVRRRARDDQTTFRTPFVLDGKPASLQGHLERVCDVLVELGERDGRCVDLRVYRVFHSTSLLPRGAYAAPYCSASRSKSKRLWIKETPRGARRGWRDQRGKIIPSKRASEAERGALGDSGNAICPASTLLAGDVLRCRAPFCCRI